MATEMEVKEIEILEERTHSRLQKFGLLTKFMLPLVVTQMVPDMAEQVLYRGITFIASDEMVTLLASFGLASYIARVFAANAMELRHVGIVLVHTKSDHKKMLLMSLVVGIVLSSIILVISLTPLGEWYIRDLHGQSQEVTDITLTILAYLSPSPLIEAIANYFEGGLICHKLTGYAGAARLVDVGMQILFIIVLLFMPTRTVPELVPIFALYAGFIARLILDVGFWYVLVRRKLPESHETEKPLTIGKGLWFWFPITLVRLVQVTSRPAINLVVSSNISKKAGEEAAAKAIAVLTAIYPIGRLLFSWLNDLRTVPPTFHKKTDVHEKFDMKTLTIYAVLCTITVYGINVIIFWIPGPGYFIMHTIVGLNEELANLCLTPLKIFTGLCLCVGVRAHLSGILIMKKKTIYLTPSAIARMLALILFLSTLSQTSLTGADLGITCLLLSFVVEATFVCGATLVVRYKPDLSLTCCSKIKREEVEDSVHDGEAELQPLTEPEKSTKV